MPVLDYTTLKAFMHPALLDSFPDEEDGGENATMKAAITVAIQRYNALVSRIPDKAVVRFDSVSFQLKVAFCHIYEFILHDTGYLTAISLTGLSISENQVWEHFKALLDMERKDIDKMVDDLLEEIEDKEDASYGGVVLYHSFGGSSKSRKRRS